MRGNLAGNIGWSCAFYCLSIGYWVSIYRKAAWLRKTFWAPWLAQRWWCGTVHRPPTNIGPASSSAWIFRRRCFRRSGLARRRNSRRSASRPIPAARQCSCRLGRRSPPTSLFPKPEWRISAPGNRTGRLEPGWRDAAAIRSMRRRSIRAFRSGRAIRAVSATGSAIEVIAPESSGQRGVDLDLAPRSGYQARGLLFPQ
jgi:hypothetical protein